MIPNFNASTILAPTSGLPRRKLETTRAHQRYILADGSQVPGGSTIAKLGSNPDPLLRWAWEQGRNGFDFRKVKEKAADVGTICHFMIECFLLGYQPDLEECSADDMRVANFGYRKFSEFWEDEELSDPMVETQLVSEKYRYGGTLDIVCRDRRGRRVLVDWKTSKGIWDEYIYQVAGYEQLWNEHNPNDKIQKRIIARLGKKEEGDFEIRPLSSTTITSAFEVFKNQVALYHAMRRFRGK